MVDEKKVITALETCASNIDCKEICPYYYPMGRPCVEAMCKDALELLKEQEPVKPKIDAFNHPYCPECKVLVYPTWSYCPHCGKEMKWK